MTRRTLTLLGMLTLAIAAARFPAIAIFSSLALLIGGLTLKRPFGAFVIVGLVLMTLLNAFAMFQFVIHMAVSGVVAGGERALTRSAVSALRKVVFVQDIGRQRGLVDPDGDGIGSALTFGELMSGQLRGGHTVSPLLLRFAAAATTDDGEVIAEREGYLYSLHLPKADGKIDDEAAERRYVAYAWPAQAGEFTEVVYVDEHERVFVSDNTGANQQYVGTTRAPKADAALTGPDLGAAPGQHGQDGGTWRAWKGKRARKRVVGDTASADPT